MFAPSLYLRWARRLYGRVRFDLATSGVPTVPTVEIGVPTAREIDDGAGHERLRDAIAAHNGLAPQQCIAALGTTHAIWLAYATLAEPGDEILIESPGYEPLVRIAEGVGARVTRFERAAEHRFELDPDRIAPALTARTRVVVVTNLHNPSGVRAPDDVLREIARLAATRGAYLLVDEVYAPFDALVDEHGVFRGTARRLAPNVVAVSSLTKCYGVGPQRVGWLLGPPEVIARAEDAVLASCGMLPLAHAHIALKALASVSTLAETARASLGGKRVFTAEWAQSQGLQWSAPAEGLFGLVTTTASGDITPGIERMAVERQVLVAPGAFFGVPNAFRLAWSAPADVFAEGLARLSDGIRTLC